MRSPNRAVFAVLLLAAPVLAGEGKWTPQQVLAQGPAWVKAQGFGLPARAPVGREGGWRPAGQRRAAARLLGQLRLGRRPSRSRTTTARTASCRSTRRRRRTCSQDGYLARTRADEKKAGAFRIQVPRAFRDVTREVAGRGAARGDRPARFEAVEAQRKALVAECESTPGTRCQFAEFDGGLFFTLTEFEEIKDVRLVYAPPLGVGNFGGEVDNWSWPRHTGDFSLLRAYKDGAPYRPRHFFPVSTKGVREGDAVAVARLPGAVLPVVDRGRDEGARGALVPRGPRLYAEWIGILDEEAARSPEAAIAHRRRPARAREHAEERRGPDRGPRAAGGSSRSSGRRTSACSPGPRSARRASPPTEAHAGLAGLNERSLRTWDRDFLLDVAPAARAACGGRSRSRGGPRRARSPTREREPGYMERDLPRMRDQLERDQKRYDGGGGPAALPLVGEARPRAAGGPAHRARWTRRSRRRRTTPRSTRAIAQLYEASRVFDLAARKAMFDETPGALAGPQGPAPRPRLRSRRGEEGPEGPRDAAAGAILRLRPAWRRAVIAEAGQPVAPDANGSLRVTFGRVRGYSPREAVTMAPQTTLAGAVEKHTGHDPFDLPAPVREAFAAKRFGRWADPALGHVPIGFLSDCDTTGGNSGSPTIDGQGRLVGVNFDRVWENVANDFGYNPDVARNVSADVRYLLWNLDVIEGASDLLKELGVGGE